MRDFPLRLQHSSGEVLSLERDRVLVGFASSNAAAEADQVLSELGLMAEEEVESYAPSTDPGVVRLVKPLNRTETRVWARTVDGTAFRASSFESPDRTIEWIAPVYRLEGQVHSEPFAVLAHVLLINAGTHQEDESFSELLDQYFEGLEPAARYPAVVQEEVIASVVGGDKAVAFLVVEPLDRSLGHVQKPAFLSLG